MAIGTGLTIKKRMFIVLLGVFGIFFLILIVRIFLLQVVDGSFYSGKALKQQLSTATVTPNRGTIYDRNMKPLAQSATVWDVIVSPAYIKSDAERNSIADHLAQILDMDRQKIYGKLIKKTSYETIQKKLEKPEADLVTQYITENKIDAIGLIPDSKRYYPFGSLASQVLGFTGTDNQGLSGLESEYDSVLKGVSGKVLTGKNATGTDLPNDYSDYVPAQDGNNLVLTIDEVVQHYLENALTKAVNDDNITNRAAGIVMNVKTGEILAMATEPGFDPNEPFTISDESVRQSLSSLSGDALKTATQNALQAQWRNKAITEPYEPGSVFKVITASAGLQEGVVSENSQFSCGGSTTVAGTRFRCWKSAGHGPQNFIEGFENSCNVVFIQVGQSLGVTKFCQFFSAFGLTAKTGIDLPGEAASIYIKQKQMGKVELASSSFGQSNKITPIELITAAAAATNGGKLVQPHLVEAETNTSGGVIKTFGTTVKRQVISAATSKEIDKLMQLEVIDGTGSNAYVPGYRVGGKTGTSQKLDSPDKSARIASFVGIAPSDDPQYAILIVLDEPHSQIKYGGVIAAPVAGDVLSNILPYLGVEPKYTEDELKKLDENTPDVTGKTLAQATNTLQQAGLKIKTIGGGDTVTAQVPLSGESIPKEGTVIVYTGSKQEENSVTVPKLVGLSPDQVNSKLAEFNLNFKPVGIVPNGAKEVCYEQDYAEGAKVPPGTVITAKFRDDDVPVE